MSRERKRKRGRIDVSEIQRQTSEMEITVDEYHFGSITK